MIGLFSKTASGGRSGGAGSAVASLLASSTERAGSALAQVAQGSDALKSKLSMVGQMTGSWLSSASSFLRPQQAPQGQSQ